MLGALDIVAVADNGHILGISDATTEKMAQAFQDGKIKPEPLTDIRKLEIQYKSERPSVA